MPPPWGPTVLHNTDLAGNKLFLPNMGIHDVRNKGAPVVEEPIALPVDPFHTQRVPHSDADKVGRVPLHHDEVWHGWAGAVSEHTACPLHGRATVGHIVPDSRRDVVPESRVKAAIERGANHVDGPEDGVLHLAALVLVCIFDEAVSAGLAAVPQYSQHPVSPVGVASSRLGGRAWPITLKPQEAVVPLVVEAEGDGGCFAKNGQLLFPKSLANDEGEPVPAATLALGAPVGPEGPEEVLRVLNVLCRQEADGSFADPPCSHPILWQGDVAAEKLLVTGILLNEARDRLFRLEISLCGTAV